MIQEHVFGGRYRPLGVAGDGGMAQVYQAVDERLGRRVVVKVLHPTYNDRPDFVARFAQEAHFVASLSHPHIVGVYDVGDDEDGSHYIVMEYVEGENLKELIRREGPLSLPLAREIGRQLCAALDYAHEHGIIHRDIKPENILLTPTREVKVGDFGIARALESSGLTPSGMVLGSASYLAPEQAQGRPVTTATDLYAVGVVLYEMLTRHLPFTGATAVAVATQHIVAAPPPPSTLNPRLASGVDTVVLKALAKDPAERYQSGAALMDALTRLGDSSNNAVRAQAATAVAVPAPPRPMRSPPRATPGGAGHHSGASQHRAPARTRRIGRGRLLLSLALAMLLLGALAGGLAMGDRALKQAGVAGPHATTTALAYLQKAPPSTTTTAAASAPATRPAAMAAGASTATPTAPAPTARATPAPPTATPTTAPQQTALPGTATAPPPRPTPAATATGVPALTTRPVPVALVRRRHPRTQAAAKARGAPALGTLTFARGVGTSFTPIDPTERFEPSTPLADAIARWPLGRRGQTVRFTWSTPTGDRGSWSDPALCRSEFSVCYVSIPLSVPGTYHVGVYLNATKVVEKTFVVSSPTQARAVGQPGRGTRRAAPPGGSQGGGEAAVRKAVQYADDVYRYVMRTLDTSRLSSAFGPNLASVDEQVVAGYRTKHQHVRITPRGLTISQVIVLGPDRAMAIGDKTESAALVSDSGAVLTDMGTATLHFTDTLQRAGGRWLVEQVQM